MFKLWKTPVVRVHFFCFQSHRIKFIQRLWPVNNKRDCTEYCFIILIVTQRLWPVNNKRDCTAYCFIILIFLYLANLLWLYYNPNKLARDKNINMINQYAVQSRLLLTGHRRFVNISMINQYAVQSRLLLTGHRRCINDEKMKWRLKIDTILWCLFSFLFIFFFFFLVWFWRKTVTFYVKRAEFILILQALNIAKIRQMAFSFFKIFPRVTPRTPQLVLSASTSALRTYFPTFLCPMPI